MCLCLTFTSIDAASGMCSVIQSMISSRRRRGGNTEYFSHRTGTTCSDISDPAIVRGLCMAIFSDNPRPKNSVCSIALCDGFRLSDSVLYLLFGATKGEREMEID